MDWNNMEMNDNVAVVLHGFLELPNLDKLRLVEAINEYFDSDDRDPIRALNREHVASIRLTEEDLNCPCCGR